MKRVSDSFGDGGSGLSRGQKIRGTNGDYYLKDVLSSAHAEADTVAAAQALGVDDRLGVLLVRSALFGVGRFRWDPDSLANDTSGQLAIRPTDIDSGDPGRWVRDDASFPLYVEATFATANNAVLYTVPTGVRLQITARPFATVTQSYASVGGAALGLSSSNSAYNTAGDLFGGATGSLSAALAAGIRAGTIGAKLASQGLVVLVGVDTIKADVFTSTFEAGAAKFCIPVMQV
jgi:hypothetical protein